jgi:hypothetical protein
MGNVIDGFEQLTPQQCFDMAARHVLTNGKQSAELGSCVYSGIGCAAAPFLTSEARASLKAVWSELVDGLVVPAANGALIRGMQICHDDADDSDGDAAFVSDFKRRMRSLAVEKGLSPAVLDSQP